MGRYTRTVWPDDSQGSPGIRLLYVTVAVVKLDNPLIAETVLKLSEFLPRGLANVQAEWTLLATAGNPRTCVRLWRRQRAAAGNPRTCVRLWRRQRAAA